MRILLAVLFACLVGCAAVPPMTGGVYHNSDQCAAVWQSEDFPLEVVVDRRLSPERQRALQEAIQTWNDVAGTTVFTITREIDWYEREMMYRHDGTIYVMQGDLTQVQMDGLGYILGLCNLDWHDCHNHNALVTIDLAAPDWGASLIFEHELGHALGLTHDNWQPSIMWPYVLESGARVLPDDRNFVQWELTNDHQGNPSLSTSDAGTDD